MTHFPCLTFLKFRYFYHPLRTYINKRFHLFALFCFFTLYKVNLLRWNNSHNFNFSKEKIKRRNKQKWKKSIGTFKRLWMTCSLLIILLKNNRENEKKKQQHELLIENMCYIYTNRMFCQFSFLFFLVKT